LVESPWRNDLVGRNSADDLDVLLPVEPDLAERLGEESRTE